MKNKKPIIAYKVVFNKEGYFSSSFMICPEYGEYHIKYEIGKITKPKIGKIFVFKTLKFAKSYICNSKRFSILEGEAFNVGTPIFVANCFIKDIDNFWNIKLSNKKIPDYIKEIPPPGTLSCDAFKPTKLMY